MTENVTQNSFFLLFSFCSSLLYGLINFFAILQGPLLATVKRQKLAWFGSVTRHDHLTKTILQGTVEGG